MIVIFTILAVTAPSLFGYLNNIYETGHHYYECVIEDTASFNEIMDTYEFAGLARAVSLVNQIFSTSFDPVDNQIYNMLQYLSRIGYRKYGETIYDSNLIAMLSNCVEGVNHLTFSDIIFPIVVPENEITTIGTYTINEV